MSAGEPKWYEDLIAEIIKKNSYDAKFMKPYKSPPAPPQWFQDEMNKVINKILNDIKVSTIEELKEALRFYANKDTYNKLAGHNLYPEIDYDQGMRAREVLKMYD